MLSGFTLIRGQAGSGGGAFSEASGVVTNCTLTGNSASEGGGASGGSLYNCLLTENSGSGPYSFGGGADGATLYNCVLTENSASGDYGYGGGVYGSTLYNCTLMENSAYGGGGADSSALNNCIVQYNTEYATGVLDNYSGSPLNYCCTTPLPAYGVGNITNAPLFVDYAGGNLRLQSNSPCLNAGLNAYVTNTTDLDSLPRIVSGTVDIGAYEFQGAGSVISYAWLQHYGLPTDGSADATDPDADGHTTWQEWRCQTHPTNALSVLRLLSALGTGTNVTVSWQSVAGVSYFLERSTNLTSPLLFRPLVTSIPGQPGSTTYKDPNALGVGPFFYRVGVRN